VAARVVPFLAQFGRDSIPNIRFNAAKAMERLAGKIDGATRVATVRPMLMALAGDAEDDVKFYATRALAAMM